ncbi:MAG: 50S ribosomal protein L6 [Candidatus Marinimicrobia bacterium]|nr:50S ribosomal protein L6 [Candidatus Neomarinimicrobiota bacterium]
MSQIGKKPISIPSGIEIEYKNNSFQASKGGKILSCIVHDEVSLDINENEIFVKRKDDSKKAKELHGLTRALMNNILKGLDQGFQKELNLVGVGYTVENKNEFLLLNLGFSHPIYFQKPDGIDFETPNNTTIIVRGIDNQLVGDVSAKIRELRKPEPYKGKGVKYKDEIIRRKAGKTVGGAA